MKVDSTWIDSPSQHKEVGLWLIGNNHHDRNTNETNQHTRRKCLCNVFRLWELKTSTTNRMTKGRYHSEVQYPTDEMVRSNRSTDETSLVQINGESPVHSERRRKFKSKKTTNGRITSLGSTLTEMWV